MMKMTRIPAILGKGFILTLALGAQHSLADDETAPKPPETPAFPPPVAVVPRFVDLPATVKVEDVIIDRHNPHDGADESSTEEDDAPVSYRVYAKVTNHGAGPIALPTFSVHLDSASQEDCQGSQASFVISPGETKVYLTGGLYTSAKTLRQAKTAQLKISAGSDIFAQAGHDRQIKYVPTLSFDPPSFELLPQQPAKEIKAELKNPAGLHLRTVRGTAAVFDKQGHLMAAKPFDYTPERGIIEVVFAPETIDRAATCVLIADYFSEEPQ